MNKPVILTGLRANSDLHIGNYFGALLPLIDMAKIHAGECQINLFVPDLHSFTTPIDHAKLYEQTMHNLRLFAAAGLPLDSDDIHIYRQSFVPAHSELTVILNNFAYFGELNRMTQFKEKSKPTVIMPRRIVGYDSSHQIISEDTTPEVNVRVGLLDYPVLMASDILLYGAAYVPVGDDQTQHLEITRDIAERMNNKFGELFVVPKPVKEQHEFFGKDQGLRIKDLLDPTKKMSKSDESGKGVIFLGDSPEAARQKIMGAATDSYGEIKFDMTERQGVSNLLQILALLQNRALPEVIKDYEGQTQYGPLKNTVADEIAKFLEAFQTSLASVDEQKLQAKLEASEAAMNAAANATLLKVQKAVGLRP